MRLSQVSEQVKASGNLARGDRMAGENIQLLLGNRAASCYELELTRISVMQPIGCQRLSDRLDTGDANEPEIQVPVFEDVYRWIEQSCIEQALASNGHRREEHD